MWSRLWHGGDSAQDWWKQHPRGSPPSVTIAPNGEQGTSGPPALGSDLAGNPGGRRSQRPVPAPRPPTPRRSPQALLLWVSPAQAVPLQDAPAGGPESRKERGSQGQYCLFQPWIRRPALLSFGICSWDPRGPPLSRRLKVTQHQSRPWELNCIPLIFLACIWCLPSPRSPQPHIHKK